MTDARKYRTPQRYFSFDFSVSVSAMVFLFFQLSVSVELQLFFSVSITVTYFPVTLQLFPIFQLLLQLQLTCCYLSVILQFQFQLTE